MDTPRVRDHHRENSPLKGVGKRPLWACFLLSSVMLWACASAQAELYHHVEIDLSALAGRDITLDFALYNNNDVEGDSWVFIDNVSLGSTFYGFEESDALDVWYSGLPPDLDDEVMREPGAFSGQGHWLMKIAEGALWPVLAATDFDDIPADSILSFDMKAHMSDDAGEYGLDEFVVTIYDWTGDETCVFGDFEALFINAAGIETSPETTAILVPVPGAFLLGMMGLSFAGIRYRRKLNLG